MKIYITITYDYNSNFTMSFWAQIGSTVSTQSYTSRNSEVQGFGLLTSDGPRLTLHILDRHFHINPPTSDCKSDHAVPAAQSLTRLRTANSAARKSVSTRISLQAAPPFRTLAQQAPPPGLLGVALTLPRLQLLLDRMKRHLEIEKRRSIALRRAERPPQLDPRPFEDAVFRVVPTENSYSLRCNDLQNRLLVEELPCEALIC